MPHLYVYYRVKKEHAGMLRDLVTALQQHLGGTDGRFRLRRRAGNGTGERETWMEIYEEVPPDFERRMDLAVRKMGLDDWIAGPRNVERFEDV